MRTNKISEFIKLRRQLSEERGTIESRLRELDEALSGMPLPSLAVVGGATGETASAPRGGRRGRRRMPAEARARIAAAQRARWAKQKRGKSGDNGASTPAGRTAKPKRTMSAAARKAIAEAARKRWAAAKAAGRSRL